MTTLAATELIARKPDRSAWRRTRHLPLGWVGFGAVLLYAQTTMRFGHALAVADAHLYYAHAHSWYFDADCDYENNIAGIEALEVRDYYLARRSPGGRVVNIFPCGWSIVAMPFLAAADGLTALHNVLADSPLPRDGHSAYYRAVIPFGHVLLGWIGLWASYVLASRYFPTSVAAWSTAFVWMGTNASYFISVEPTMSHASSLGFVSLMVLAADTIHRSGWRLSRAVALGGACGMMVAVRHQNVAWLVIPLLLLLPELVRSAWHRRPGWARAIEQCLIALLVFVLCLAPQVGVNLATHGTVFGQLHGFLPDWFHPAFARELVTIPTGLFVLYPLTAVCALSGVITAWKARHLALTKSLVAGGIAMFYINACAAFGPSRRYACFSVLFILGLAAAVDWARRVRWRTAVVGTVVAVLCAGNITLLVLADRCLVDRALFTACPPEGPDMPAVLGGLLAP